MALTIPFYPQKWNLSDWRALGFDNYADAEYWEKSSCGVLCLKMAIDAFLNEQGKPKSPSISEYIKKGVEIGAYTDALGWNHAGLVRLAQYFGIPATAHKIFNTQEIKDALLRNCLCIISIKWAFKPRKSLKEKIFPWKKIGGHLALVVGFKEEGGILSGFYVNHTSILQEYNWENTFIPIKKFREGFTDRGIVIGE